MDKDSIPYHDLTVAVFLIILLPNSNQEPKSKGRATKPAGSSSDLARLVWISLCILVPVVLMLGCTPGNLTQSSTGWSPVAAAPIPASTGSMVDEVGTFSPLDNLLTVTDPSPFVVGHIIQIGGEQMEITSIAFRDLSVTRGENGTQPAAHPDGSEVLLLAGDLAIYVGTKQGAVKGLRDDGSGLPSVDWTYSPVGSE